jgi:CubicO group peptidase (beta-lactamase class C family)
VFGEEATMVKDNGGLIGGKPHSTLRRSRSRRTQGRALRLRHALPVSIMLAIAPVVPAQDVRVPAARDGVASIEQRTERFIEQLDKRRTELGVPGAAVVVAQQDRIVRATGLGVRNLESREPVTDETVFAVGSVTKQFTAMSVVLAVSEGKMALEDHPRKYVPAFHLQDPDADANVNLIDLLTHRTGLDRSDVTWLLAPFTQAEIFELAARSKPAAKLRERFLYNNTMYAVAGAAVASAYATTYERFLTERLLTPLGMRSSTLTLEGLTAAPNRALGYERAGSCASKPAKPTNLTSIAPAGALNTTARDLGAWLVFLNSRGQTDNGPRIVPATFARLFEAHQPTGPNSSYGLGFFLETRSGVVIANHGGNVPGYSAEVVHVPERALGFAVLANQGSSQLGTIAQELFWEIVVKPELSAANPAEQPEQEPEAATPPPQPIATELLVGEYFATDGATFVVKKRGSKLVAAVAGQPPYPLKSTAVNAYDLTGLNGYSLTFVASAAMPGRFTAFLRQPPCHPGGNLVYLKKDDPWLARAKAQYEGPEKELIGSYHSDDRLTKMEIVPYRRGVALIITGQTPWPLVGVGVDLFRLGGLPESYRVQVRQSGSKRAFGFVLQQPNQQIEMSVAEPATAGDIEQARTILERAVDAAGGAQLLDRIASRTALGRASAPGHGIDGRAEDRVQSGKRAELVELGAFGKTVVSIKAVTNDQRSVAVSYDGDETTLTGKAREAARFFAVAHPLHRWKERFAKVAAVGETAVNGENAVIIELTAPGLAPARLYISPDSFLILREEVPAYLGDDLQSTGYGADYSDYRVVDGIRTPFTVAVTLPILGRATLSYDSVSYEQTIDPAVFDAP